MLNAHYTDCAQPHVTISIIRLEENERKKKRMYNACSLMDAECTCKRMLTGLKYEKRRKKKKQTNENNYYEFHFDPQAPSLTHHSRQESSQKETSIKHRDRSFDNHTQKLIGMHNECTCICNFSDSTRTRRTCVCVCVKVNYVILWYLAQRTAAALFHIITRECI